MWVWGGMKSLNVDTTSSQTTPSQYSVFAWEEHSIAADVTMMLVLKVVECGKEIYNWSLKQSISSLIQPLTASWLQADEALWAF